MISVLFVTHENFGKTAVAKAMFFDIAKALSSSFSVSLFSAKDTSNSNLDREIPTGNHNYFYRKNQGKISVSDIARLLTSTFRLAMLVFKHDYTIVRSYPMMFFCVPFSLLGKKIIFDTRGLFFDELIDSGKIKSKLILKLLRFFEWVFLKCSYRVTCVSESQRDFYIGRYKRIDREKLKVIYNGMGVNEGGCKKAEAINGRKTIAYVGSLVSWHMPERVSSILTELQRLGYAFDFHCITRDVDIANREFSMIDNKLVYSLNFREKPISFDLGICLIKDTLSKSVCFPVKFSEYLSSNTPVVYSENIDVCRDIGNNYKIGLCIGLGDEDRLIAKKIIEFLDKSDREFISLPTELHFNTMVTKVGMLFQ